METTLVSLLTSGCDVYAFGENDCGQLGLGHNDDVEHEQKVEELSGSEINLKNIYEGNCCMFAQTVNGVIYSWGSNKWGQLGNRDTNEQGDFHKPKKVEFKVNNQEVLIIDMKCGSLHNLALSIDGKVLGWGDNHARQITEDVHGMSPKISKPVLMSPQNLTMKSIYSYDKTSFMITTDNEVYYYGRDIWGIRPTVMNDNDLKQLDYIPPMKLDFQAEALICNDEFIFYITTNYFKKIELYKYKSHQSYKLADNEPSLNVNQYFSSKQSCSNLPSSSSRDKTQQSQSPKLTFGNLGRLGTPGTFQNMCTWCNIITTNCIQERRFQWKLQKQANLVTVKKPPKRKCIVIITPSSSVYCVKLMMN